MNEEYIPPPQPISLEKIETILRIMNSFGGYVVLGIVTILSIFVSGPLGIIIVPFVYCLVYMSLNAQIAHIRFMKSYAKEHNFQYEETFDITTLRGRLFTKGGRGYPSNLIIGTHNNAPLRIFNYTYVTGYGKQQRTHPFTVCEVTIEKTKFPYIFLKSKSMSQYHSSDMFGEDQDVSIPLSPSAETYFTLSCTKNYEIETLQIFTEELLSLLKTYSQNFSIEFAENKIYFYDDKIIRDQKSLDELFTVVKMTLDNAGGLLQRLHDDFDVIREAYKKKVIEN